MQRYALRDDQWTKIKDFLPGREGHVGGTAADNRLFVDAILYRYRTGIPWRDLPERYGDWKATHKRLRRWCESGVFARLLEALAFDADAEYARDHRRWSPFSSKAVTRFHRRRPPTFMKVVTSKSSQHGTRGD